MDLTGKIKDLSFDYATRKPVISFIVDQSPNGIDKFCDSSIKIKLTKYSEKPRSLDSNRYFHVLCDKLRKELKISMAHCKNDLIIKYGQIMYVDPDNAQAFIYKTNASPEYMQEQEFIHMSLIKVGQDGAYWYRGYRGSHTYTVHEMYKLLEGTIEECKLYGIETATPDEIARMQALWEKRRNEDGEIIAD